MTTRTTEAVLKDAEVMQNPSNTFFKQDYDIRGEFVNACYLIAELSALVRERGELIEDIYKDLVFRAQFTDDKLLDLSSGIVSQIQEVLPTPPKKEK